jgi:hypothetical protein
VNLSVWTIVIAAATVIGGVVGTVAARMGKKGDQELETVRDQFARLIAEVAYWQNTATDARTEWEGRWDRQMVRCRKVTDALVVAIVRLLRGSTTPEDREVAEKALDDLREHNSSDH